MTSVIAAEAWPSDVCGAADDRRVTGTTVCKLILALLQVSNFSLVDAHPHLERRGTVVPGAGTGGGCWRRCGGCGEISLVFVESPQPTVRTITVMMQMQDSVALLAISSLRPNSHPG